MNIFITLYNEILWRPMFNGLVWIYNILPWRDLGLAIVVFTVAIRLILTPLLLKSRKAQKDINFIQPEVKKIQEKFKNDKENQGKALMELYAKHKVNPFSGCLMMIIQLPILIALFQVFRKGIGMVEAKYLYPFVVNPQVLYPLSFGLLDLSKGNIYLGIVAALTQYLQTKMTINLSAAPVAQDKTKPKPDFASTLQWQTLYVFPALILVWSYTLPSALVLYWTVLNILGIVQEIIMKDKSQIVHPNT